MLEILIVGSVQRWGYGAENKDAGEQVSECYSRYWNEGGICQASSIWDETDRWNKLEDKEWIREDQTRKSRCWK